MRTITFKSYVAWEDYAKEYCEENVERIFEMPEQDEIDSIVNDVLYQGFSIEYNLHVDDVVISDDLRKEVESGVRAYISEQIEENTVPATVFETICDALDVLEDDHWIKTYLKENRQYTKVDLCAILHNWLDMNTESDIY